MPRPRDIADPLLEFLRAELGACSYVEPPTPLRPGNETTVYALRLGGLPPPLDRGLVLRLFPPRSAPSRALVESTVQNAIAAQGFPAPRAHAVCTDDQVLGAPFFLMARLSGDPLYGDTLDTDAKGLPRARLAGLLRNGAAMLFQLPVLVAEIELRLHALEAGSVAAALTRAGLDGRDLTPARRLACAEQLVDEHRLDGLRAGLDWLRENPPADHEDLVVCHGDLHPLNLLFSARALTGVLDWSNAALAPPEFEIGWMRAAYRTIPLPLPGPLRRAERVIGSHLAARFSNAYARRRRLDGSAVSYYEAFRDLVGLALLAAHLARDEDARDAWNSPAAIERVGEHFRSLTGRAISIA